LRKQRLETHGKHESRIEDGGARADEAGELAGGELPVGGGVEAFHGQIVDSSLPVLGFSCPAISSEHAHSLSFFFFLPLLRLFSDSI